LCDLPRPFVCCVLIDDAQPQGVLRTMKLANCLHAEHGLEALRAGKHVLVEKPMATSVDDAVALVRAAREAERRLGVSSYRLPADRQARGDPTR